MLISFCTGCGVMFSKCLFLLGLAIELCKNFLLWRFLVRGKKKKAVDSAFILYRNTRILMNLWLKTGELSEFAAHPGNHKVRRCIQLCCLDWLGLHSMPDFGISRFGGGVLNPNTGTIHSATEPGDCLAWKSMYGLSRLLSLQIISGLSKSCDKITEEIHCSLMHFYLVPC